MSQIILYQPRIRALIGQGEAASVTQHVGMRREGQGRGHINQNSSFCIVFYHTERTSVFPTCLLPLYGAGKAGSISEWVIEFCCARNTGGRGKFVIDAPRATRLRRRNK